MTVMKTYLFIKEDDSNEKLFVHERRRLLRKVICS